MPSKSRNKKFSQAKKKRELNQASVAAQGPATSSATPEPISRPNISVSSANRVVPSAKTAVVPHPYIGRELKNIGILTGVMLVVLIILALILPRVLP